MHSVALLGIFDVSTSALTNLLDRWGYPLVGIVVAVESSGIPFPGETMLVTAAVYAGTGHLSIFWVIVAVAASAITGDNCGFLADRSGGRTLVLRYGHYLRVKPNHLDRAEQFFDRHGDKTVFFGRHFAILRAWAAFFAGMNRMSWRKFLLYNATGGILWVTIYGLLGYTLGNNLPVLQRVIQLLGVGGFVAAAAVIVLGAIILWRRRRVDQPIDRGAASPQEPSA